MLHSSLTSVSRSPPSRSPDESDEKRWPAERTSDYHRVGVCLTDSPLSPSPSMPAISLAMRRNGVRKGEKSSINEGRTKKKERGLLRGARERESGIRWRFITRVRRSEQPARHLMASPSHRSPSSSSPIARRRFPRGLPSRRGNFKNTGH